MRRILKVVGAGRRWAPGSTAHESLRSSSPRSADTEKWGKESSKCHKLEGNLKKKNTHQVNYSIRVFRQRCGASVCPSVFKPQCGEQAILLLDLTP